MPLAAEAGSRTSGADSVGPLVDFATQFPLREITAPVLGWLLLKATELPPPPGTPIGDVAKAPLVAMRGEGAPNPLLLLAVVPGTGAGHPLAPGLEPAPNALEKKLCALPKKSVGAAGLLPAGTVHGFPPAQGE